jgi:putative hydrolase of the HAD superfamily
VDPKAFHSCRVLLFDFGGTLDAEGEHWLDRFFALYAVLGLGVPREKIKEAFYHADALCHSDPDVAVFGLRPFVDRHVRLQFEFLGLSERWKQREMVEAFCCRAEYFLARRAALLDRLKERFQIGIVSNFFGNLAVVCDEAGLSNSLHTIIDSGVVGVSKPDPAIFRLALTRLGCAPEETLSIGDSYERDMMPSMELGIGTVWLKGPNPRLPDSPRPVDAYIESLSRLEELVQ